MEDWEKGPLITRIIDHLLGIAVAAAILVFVLKILAAQTGGRHYDAWTEICESARAAAAGKARPK